MAQLKYSKTTDGSRVGELVEISKPRFTIGRHDDDLVITDGQLSRDHAWIELTDSGHLIHDCNSANGTWVNEQRITTQLLKDGDAIRFGETIMTYVASTSSCICGNQLEASAKFCRTCGAPAPTPAAAEVYPATQLSIPSSNVPSAAPAPVAPAPAPAVAQPAPAPIAQPAPAPAPSAQPAPSPAATTPAPRPSSAPMPRRRSSLRFVGGFLIGGIVVAVVLLFVIPREYIDSIRKQISSMAPTEGVDAGKPTNNPKPSAAPAGYESKTIDLEHGGRVKLGGVGVMVQPSTGKGQAAVRVRRVVHASDPPEKGGGGVSDVFDILIEKSKTGSVHLKQPVGLVIPLAKGARLPTQKDERPVVLTRADATQPWKVESAVVIYDPASRTYRFTLPHLTHAAVTNRGSMLRRMLESVSVAVGNVKRKAAYHMPTEHTHLSPHKFFKILYTLRGKHAVKYPSWLSLSGEDTSPLAPHFVEDVGVYLEKALPYLAKISDGRGKKLFPPKWIKSLKPLAVRIEDLGGDAGESPIGVPLVLSSHIIDNTKADLRAVATHELIHVLQDRYYVAPYIKKWPTFDTIKKNTWRIDKWQWGHKSGGLVAAMNKWFLEATADLWAGRRAGAGAEAYWFREDSGYLAKSLTTADDGSMYAAAHFLDYLEREVGQPVVAQAMIDGDHKLSDLTGLKNAVARAGHSFDKLYDQYARMMYVGKSPDGFADEHTPALMGLSRHDLYEEINSDRPAISAGLIKLKIDAAEIQKPTGLLVIDLCGSPKQIKTYTYLAKGDPDTYLEKPNSKVKMIHRGCARAIPYMGGSRNYLWLVNVNTADGRSSMHRLWLLLPPTDVTFSKEHVSWKHQNNGLTGLRYNIWMDDRRLNSKPVSGSRFRVGDLTGASQQQLWVSVVDSKGFEWPKSRPNEKLLSGRWNIRFKLKGAKHADPPLLYDFDKMIPKGHIVGKDGDFITLESPGFAAMMQREPNASGTKLWMKFNGPTLSGRAQSGRVDSYKDRVVRRLQPLTITGTRLP